MLVSVEAREGRNRQLGQCMTDKLWSMADLTEMVDATLPM
jgi:hypothetical protein